MWKKLGGDVLDSVPEGFLEVAAELFRNAIDSHENFVGAGREFLVLCALFLVGGHERKCGDLKSCWFLVLGSWLERKRGIGNKR